MRITLHHWGVLIASHSLFSEQAKFDLGENICRNAAATAFRLGCRITTGTPFPPQNVYRNGVPVRSSTTTPLIMSKTSIEPVLVNPCIILPSVHDTDMTRTAYYKTVPTLTNGYVMNCSVLCCVRQLCTMIHAHTREQFIQFCTLGLDFFFVFLCFVFCVFFHVSLCHFILVLHAFVLCWV